MIVSQFAVYFLEKEAQDKIDLSDLEITSIKEIVIPFKDGEKSFYVNHTFYKEVADLLSPESLAKVLVEVEIKTITPGTSGMMIRHDFANSEINLDEVEYFYVIDNGKKVRYDFKEDYKHKISEVIQRVDNYLLKETVFKLNEYNIRKLYNINESILKEKRNGNRNVH